MTGSLQQLAATLAVASGAVPHGAGRPAAVLALFAATAAPDLMFTERAATLRRHAGQVSFPGGSIDATDASPEAAAVRETQEEIGLDPAHVTVLGRLPATRPTVTRYAVTAVVAQWPGAEPLVAAATEVARVSRVPVSVLADPAVRVSARHPSGWTGPAFWVADDLVIWGFTASLVDDLLRLGGWQRPWHHGRVVDVPRRFLQDGPVPPLP